jgi:hypothetical protein
LITLEFLKNNYEKEKNFIECKNGDIIKKDNTNSYVKKIIIGYDKITQDIIEVNENIEYFDLTKYNIQKSSIKNLNLLNNVKRIILTLPSELLHFNNTLQYLEEICFFGKSNKHLSNIGANIGPLTVFEGGLVPRSKNILIFPNLKKIILSDEYDFLCYEARHSNPSQYDVFTMNLMYLLRGIRTKNNVNVIFKNKNIRFVRTISEEQICNCGVRYGYYESNIDEFNKLAFRWYTDKFIFQIE